MLSILAGMMIAIGGIINLTVGGIAGAIFFSIGLLTILHFKFQLFTGKAGLLSTGEIKPSDLATIWIGNFVGCAIVAFMVALTPRITDLSDGAAAIINTRLTNGPIANLILGIFCGMLMYIAVTGYKETKNVIFVAFPVAVFILSGFNHCVADMFYFCIGATDQTIDVFATLIPTTLGNIIGCNLLPYCRLLE